MGDWIRHLPTCDRGGELRAGGGDGERGPLMRQVRKNYFSTMAVLSDPLKSFKNNDLIKALRELCRQTCSKKRSTRVNHTCTLPLPPSPPSLFHTKNDPKTHTTHFPPQKKRTLQKSRDVVSYRVVRSGNGSLDNGEEEEDGRGVEGRGAQEEGGWKKKAFAFLGRKHASGNSFSLFGQARLDFFVYCHFLELQSSSFASRACKIVFCRFAKELTKVCCTIHQMNCSLYNI